MMNIACFNVRIRIPRVHVPLSPTATCRLREVSLRARRNTYIKRSAPYLSSQSLPLHNVASQAIRQRRIVATMFTFIEWSTFEAARSVYLDEDEFAGLQQFMMQNPEAGQIVPGSGGVRKLR